MDVRRYDRYGNPMEITTEITKKRILRNVALIILMSTIVAIIPSAIIYPVAQSQIIRTSDKYRYDIFDEDGNINHDNVSSIKYDTSINVTIDNHNDNFNNFFNRPQKHVAKASIHDEWYYDLTYDQKTEYNDKMNDYFGITGGDSNNVVYIHDADGRLIYSLDGIPIDNGGAIYYQGLVNSMNERAKYNNPELFYLNVILRLMIWVFYLIVFVIWLAVSVLWFSIALEGSWETNKKDKK